MGKSYSYCRQCEAFCGVEMTVDQGQILDVAGNPNSPLSKGYVCSWGKAVEQGAATKHRRVTHPMVRRGDQWETVSWDEALQQIGERWSAVRRAAGAQGVGLHLGRTVSRSSFDWFRALLFGWASGTPNVFADEAQTLNPMRLATEEMMGHSTVLQADVTRADYVLLLGGNQGAGHWGPYAAGTVQLDGMLHQQAAHRARMAVVDPRRTALAEQAHIHVPIRPGTDLFFLIGVVRAILDGGWEDGQYVRDYTTGLETLRRSVQPWSVQRCAELCGVEPSAITGLALKFARAPRGCIHLGRSALTAGHGGLTVWMALAACGLTANLLRPGGMWDNPNILDAYPFANSLRSSKAPRSRLEGIPAMAMQLPSSLMVDEVLVPGEGQMCAMLSLEGDVFETVPSSAKVERALNALDLLVCVTPTFNRTTDFADFILPSTLPYERTDGVFHLTGRMPLRFVQATHAVIPPVGEARTTDEILRGLSSYLRLPHRGGSWGKHLQTLGRFLLGRDAQTWMERAWDLLADVPMDTVMASDAGCSLGHVDRSNWRVSHADQRIHLAPESFVRALAAVQSPEADDGGDSFWLGAFRADKPGDTSVVLGTNSAKARNLVEGERVVVSSPFGRLEGVLNLDPELRDDSILVATGWGTHEILGGGRSMQGASTLGGGPVDPLTGAPNIMGTRVEVHRARSAE